MVYSLLGCRAITLAKPRGEVMGLKLDGDRVRRARHRLGYTLQMVGSEAGLAKGTAIRAEHGREIYPSTASKIAAALQVKLADLIDEPRWDPD